MFDKQSTKHSILYLVHRVNYRKIFRWIKFVEDSLLFFSFSFIDVCKRKDLLSILIWKDSLKNNKKMKFITSLFGDGSPKTMGRRYMKVGRNALLGIKPDQKNGPCSEKMPTPLSLLISRGGKLKHSRIAVICFGLLALIIGIVLSSIPWVDYIILKV